MTSNDSRSLKLLEAESGNHESHNSFFWISLIQSCQVGDQVMAGKARRLPPLVLDAWFPPSFRITEVLPLGPATFPDMVEEPWLQLSLFHWTFLCVNKVVHRLKDFEKEVKVLKLVGEYLD